MLKNLIRSFSIITIVSIIILTIPSCSSEIEHTENNFVQLLDLNQVTEAFEKEGFLLYEMDANPPEDLIQTEISDVQTKAYNINNNEGTMFIYLYESMDKAQEFPREHELIGYEDIVKTRAKNVGIAVVKDLDMDSEKALEFYSSIYNIVFYKLNDIEKLEFEGEGEFWEGNLNIVQYEHWWEGEDKRLRHESYSRKYTAVNYKKDISKINLLKIELKPANTNRNKTTFEIEGTLHENYISLGTTSSSGPLIKDDASFTMIIQWNDQKEKIALQK